MAQTAGEGRASRPDPGPGVFVTGTGTEVGKSVVAAAIARTLVNAGCRVAVFKPAATGLDSTAPAAPMAGPVDAAASVAEAAAGADDAPEADHELLRRAAASAQSDEEIVPYRYGPAASPHLAAELAAEKIEPERLRTAARAAAASGDMLVCEGVGGLLVPLCGEYLVRDFAAELALPLVVAAPPGLGTINHTLLTVEAARAAGLEVAAVVLTPWPQRPSRIEQSNRETIAALAELEVKVLPLLDLAAMDGWPALAV